MHGMVISLITLTLALNGGVSNPPCSCRPDIPADGSGDGTCSIAQDDAQWCQIRFSGSAAIPPNFSEDMAKTEVRNDSERQLALKRLGSVPPEDWNRDFVLRVVPAMLEDVLRDKAPEKLSEIRKSLPSAVSDILPVLRSRSSVTKEFSLGRYKAIASYGCLNFTSGQFSAMVKSQFSQASDRCRK